MRLLLLKIALLAATVVAVASSGVHAAPVLLFHIQDDFLVAAAAFDSYYLYVGTSEGTFPNNPVRTAVAVPLGTSAGWSTTFIPTDTPDTFNFTQDLYA